MSNLAWKDKDMGLPVYTLSITDSYKLHIHPHKDQYQCRLYKMNSHNCGTQIHEWTQDKSLDIEKTKILAVEQTLTWLHDQITSMTDAMYALGLGK